MTQPLLVDSTRLAGAATALQGLVFPVLPPQIVAAGTDLVSAAINQAMPIVESPVIDGLPAARDALARTASNIDSAAGIYVETDQQLGEHVNQVLFAATDEAPTDDDAAETPTNDPSSTLPLPPVAMPTMTELTQLSGQAAKVSNQLSRHLNLFNQGMGQIQQIVQMAQQAQADAAPAEEAAGDAEEATLAGDVDDNGAAVDGQAVAGGIPGDAVHAGTGRPPGPVGVMA